MKLENGQLCFILDEFFEKINDPYLKTSHSGAMRPHYFAFYDKKSLLYWLVPCSSRVDKFQAIIDSRADKNKPTNIIQIVKIQNNKSVLLFADMFPVIEKYLMGPYIRGGQLVCIANPKIVKNLEKNASKVIKMLHRGIKFTPTQPDVMRIIEIMRQEIENSKPE